MFTLTSKKKLLRVLVFGVVIAVIISLVSVFVAQQLKNSADAADRSSAYITPGRQISYGDGYSTNVFDVEANGGTHRGFCAQPRFVTAYGSYSYSLAGNSNSYNLVKLMIFIYENDNSITAGPRAAIYDWGGGSDSNYAWTHAIIGVAYDGDYTGAWSDAGWIDSKISILQSYINNDADVWVAAKNSNLYYTSGGGGTQDIVWIEDGAQYGGLSIEKCDLENSTCIPQGNANFSGINFEVYNASNSKIYNPRTGQIYANGDKVAEGTTDANGKLSISNLLATGVKYTVKETGTNRSYQLTASSQNVTLSSSGQQESLTFKNLVNKGKITVNKKDSSTGNCVTVGNAVFNNTVFQLINNSTNPIIYNGSSISSGGVVANATLNTTSCTVVFDNIPYGSYTVKETAVGSGYNVNTGTVNISIPDNNGSYDTTVNFTNTAILGKITVNKKDSKTNSCTTQGNATFNGTTFRIKNNSTNPIYYNNHSYAKGAVIDTKQLTGGACSVVFDGLPYGSYIIEETAVGSGYSITTASKTVTIPASGSVNVLVDFVNDAILGKITINKKDKETGSCTTTGELSFNGLSFSATNSSTNPIYYNGHAVAPGAVIDTKTLTNGACSVTFENLPYGKYTIKETNSVTGYVRNTTPQDITIPASGTSNVNVSTTFENQPIRGDVKFVKMDPNNNKPMSNVLFSISSIYSDDNIKETHLVVSNEDGVVDTSSAFALHTYKTNGYDPLYDDIYPFGFQGFGSWFGLDKNGNSISPRDEVGALPYGTYIIQELRCNSNLFCTEVMNQKATITINSHNQVIGLHDWNNTCTKFSLETTAVDAKDEDKYIEIGEKVTIKDKIDYCVKPKVDFTIKGVLMDKTTGEQLLINGQPVESEVKINSQTDCGSTEMYFTFDASELGGKEIVVFETLYYGEDIITSHEDIEDESQTVEMVYLRTFASNNLTGEKTLPVDSYAEIKDVVKYCLKPGVEYTFKGALMNKEKAEVVVFENKPVIQSVTFTPREACGEFETIYKLNTTGLDGANLVILESLYKDDELIIEHIDLNNTDETVTVESPLPAPDTGLFTGKNNGASESNNTIFIVGVVVFVSVGGYIGMRLATRKSIFKKKVDF